MFLYLEGSLLSLRCMGAAIFFRKTKINNKVVSKVDVLVVLGVFIVFTLWLLRVLEDLNSLITPPLLDIINFRNDDSFLYPKSASSATWITTDFSESLLPWLGSAVWALWLGTLFNYCSYSEIRLHFLRILLGNFSYTWDWLLVETV